MRKVVLWPVLVAVIFAGSPSYGQSVVIQENYFNDFITFYISSVDVATGAQNVDLFEIEILVDEPVRVKLEFKIRINSIPLGLDYEDEFLTVVTDPFLLRGPIRVRNTELDMSTTHLIYSGPPGGIVPISISSNNIRFINIAELESMQSLIMQTGRLPDGTYRFSLEVKDSETEAILAGWDKVVVSAHPIALELISPGGPLDDIENNMMATIYPFFQWESDPCAICTYRIRVAKFKCEEHSSAEDAIEDQTVLPLDQAAEFYDMGHATAFQYPQTGAVELEPGNIYVWQVQKVIPTTEGDEAINSFIYSFMIAEQESMDRIKSALRDMLGEEEYQQLFGICGDLMGFAGDEDGIVINGERVDVSNLEELARLISQGELSISNSEVQ